MKKLVDMIFKNPNKGFLKGMGSVLNLSGNSIPPKICNGTLNDDMIAIRKDFEIIGRDLDTVINLMK